MNVYVTHRVVIRISSMMCVKRPVHRNHSSRGSNGCHTVELCCPNSVFVSTLPFTVPGS